MRTIYLVTGAAGHLGSTIVYKLLQRGEAVRALVLPGDTGLNGLASQIEIIEGDVRNKESLAPFFRLKENEKQVVIHAAGIVSIASKKYDALVYDVNVTGTKNIVAWCRENKVSKLVHVSSVHAIPEAPKGMVMQEVDYFDPDKVHGLYAKTKAEATQVVLDAAKEGLNASVVHPSGIIGPGDNGRGHLTQLVVDYVKGRLTAGVGGGYDFVDVRDVADGVVSCVEKGRLGECYILSGKYTAVQDLLEELHQVTGRRRIKTILPVWFAKGTAPFAELYYKILRQPPLYTAYSLYTLSSNALFSHEKASKELDYITRPLRETLVDTVEWMKENGKI